MRGRSKVLGAVLIGAGAVGILTSTAHAQLLADKSQRQCLATIAKEGAKYVATRLKERTKCADKNLQVTGACDLVKRDAKLAKAETKLKGAIDKKCGDQSGFVSPDLTLQQLGFPARCPDVTGPPFVNDDLEACIFVTHRNIADGLFDLQYGANGDDAVLSFEGQGNDAATAKSLGKCQKELSKNGQKFVKTILKEVQKCRNGLLSGKVSGFAPTECANNLVEPKAKAKIDKTETKMREKIAGKCDDTMIGLMDVCGAQPTEPLATDCLVDAHRNASDNPDQNGPTDLVDVEYITRAFCGDGIANDALAGAALDVGTFSYGSPPEECDGADDEACPGQCGAPGGDFPCLCETVPRIKVEEFATIDSDNGWNGITHDTLLLAGAGYTSRLFDCDGPSGPDTLCTVGPSCTLSPHAPCTSDADCTGGGDVCRTGPTAHRPHCNNDITEFCSSDVDCPGFANFCRTTLTGAPIPVAAGGIGACTLNVLLEDVVGTTDVASGDSEVRLRQRSVTFLSPHQDRPCPVCGNFCDEPIEENRSLCTTDSDCNVGTACQLAPVCNSGPNKDLPCRTAPPAGGNSVVFGTTSIDCPVGGTALGELDSATDPRTTSSVSMVPSFSCSALGFMGNACVAGTATGQDCTVDTDCPGGGVGSCRGQCFCAAGGALLTQPNACLSACRGGTSDYMMCAADTDCPGGFCQAASCRAAMDVCVGGAALGATCGADSDCPGGACGDDSSTQEGFCPAGPTDGNCSITGVKQCANDLHCRPPSVGGTCSFCQETETCEITNRECYVNEMITRTGYPGLPVRGRASLFCIPSSGNPLIDGGGGFPGPGATEGDEFVTMTGLAP